MLGGGVFWTLAMLLVVGVTVYVALVVWLARRFALTDGSVECVEIELPTLGHHIALYHHRPEVQRFREPVIVCHGLGANRFNMDFPWDEGGEASLSLARALVARGFDVWGLELRGRGRARVPARASWSVDDEVREDVPAAIETVLDLSGAEHVLWVGHSKGSLLQYLLHAEQLPAAKKVAALVAIGSPGTFAFQKRLGPMIALGAMLARRGLPIPLVLLAKLGLPISPAIPFASRVAMPFAAAMSGPLLRRMMASLIADISPGVMTQFAEWFKGGGAITRRDGSRYEDSFKKIDLPVLFIAGEKDELAPPESIAYVKDRIGSRDVSFEVLPGYGHGDLVVSENAPKDVFPLVIRWLEERARSVWTAPRGADR